MNTERLKISINPAEAEFNRELANRFAFFMCNMELSEIENLLSDEYQYHDMSKKDFLSWLSQKFTECIAENIYSLSVKMRFCMNCKPTNPTLLFNQGFFPKEVDGNSGPKGFMLDFKDGKICDITICYKWCNEKELLFCSLNN